MTVAAGTEGLLSDLEARARAEVEAVQAETRAELDRIRAAAVEQCAELRRNASASCSAELAPSHAAARFGARQAARRIVLEAQHAAIHRVLEALPTVPCGLDKSCDTPDAVVAVRVADALSYMGDRPSELHCAPTIVGRVQKALGNRSDVRVTPDPTIAAGIRVASSDGRVVVDDTLHAWLTREAPALAIWIRDAIASGAGAAARQAPPELVHA